jgi:hypothetical protein
MPTLDIAPRLRGWFAEHHASNHLPVEAPRHRVLRALVEAELDDLPWPGGGRTLARWQALAEVAAFDLSLAKLYEGHTDALAILHEAGLPPPRRATWGVWAAEAPGARVAATPDGDGLRLEGTKAWCSGAAALDAALLTVWTPSDDRPWLVAVDLREPGIAVDDSQWQAVGMTASESANVSFDGVRAQRVGAAGFYLDRPGFWHGGAGLAACWHGGAAALARSLREKAASASPEDWPKRLALGALDVSLSACAALLRETAAAIDADPAADAGAPALRARCAAEAAAREVIERAGRALGATPFCRDAGFAQRAADLAVFVRQSHGDRDLETLGRHAAASERAPWTL